VNELRNTWQENNQLKNQLRLVFFVKKIHDRL
jgi:hypothetical protein